LAYTHLVDWKHDINIPLRLSERKNKTINISFTTIDKTRFIMQFEIQLVIQKEQIKKHLVSFYASAKEQN
jgi:hypothetical protein